MSIEQVKSGIENIISLFENYIDTENYTEALKLVKDFEICFGFEINLAYTPFLKHHPYKELWHQDILTLMNSDSDPQDIKGLLYIGSLWKIQSLLKNKALDLIMLENPNIGKLIYDKFLFYPELFNKLKDKSIIINYATMDNIIFLSNYGYLLEYESLPLSTEDIKHIFAYFNKIVQSKIYKSAGYTLVELAGLSKYLTGVKIKKVSSKMFEQYL